MSPLLVALLLSTTPVSAPAVAADATVAAAFAQPAAPASVSPSVSSGAPASSGGTLTYTAPLAALVILVAGAVVAARRKATTPRHLRVLENASLGPKRGLALVEVGGELLLLSTSEAGVSLLRVLSPEAQRIALAAQAPQLPTTDRPVFAALLSDSAEDQELREKLAAGFRAQT